MGSMAAPPLPSLAALQPREEELRTVGPPAPAPTTRPATLYSSAASVKG